MMGHFRLDAESQGNSMIYLSINLTFIRKSIRPGGSSFRPPRKHNGGGAAVARATVQTPSLSGAQDGRERSGQRCLLTSKAN